MGQCKPGHSGNPAGRPKWARIRFAEDFRGDLYGEDGDRI
jgi:hypothetical protein